MRLTPTQVSNKLRMEGRGIVEAAAAAAEEETILIVNWEHIYIYRRVGHRQTHALRVFLLGLFTAKLQLALALVLVLSFFVFSFHSFLIFLFSFLSPLCRLVLFLSFPLLHF